jgi:hypothetical protein
VRVRFFCLSTPTKEQEESTMRTFLLLSLFAAVVIAGATQSGGGDCPWYGCHEDACDPSDCGCASGQCYNSVACHCNCQYDSQCKEGYHCSFKACHPETIPTDPEGVDGIPSEGSGSGGLDETSTFLSFGALITTETEIDGHGFYGAYYKSSWSLVQSTYLQSFNPNQWNGGQVNSAVSYHHAAHITRFEQEFTQNYYWGRKRDNVPPHEDPELKHLLEPLPEETKRQQDPCSSFDGQPPSAYVCVYKAYYKCDGNGRYTQNLAVVGHNLMKSGCAMIQKHYRAPKAVGAVRDVAMVGYGQGEGGNLNLEWCPGGRPVQGQAINGNYLKSVPGFNTRACKFTDASGSVVALPVLESGSEAASWALCEKRKTKIFSDGSRRCE